MSKERDEEIKVPLGLDLETKPTDEKLVADAGDLVAQYQQFWLPGEVEVTVLLSRPGQNGAVAIGTNLHELERIRWQLRVANERAPLMGLLADKRGKLIR